MKETFDLTDVYVQAFFRPIKTQMLCVTCCFWYAVFGLIFDSNSSDPENTKIRVQVLNSLCNLNSSWR